MEEEHQGQGILVTEEDDGEVDVVSISFDDSKIEEIRGQSLFQDFKVSQLTRQ